MQSCRHLNLSYNKLAALPKDMTALQELRHLDVSYNALLRLSSGGALKQLETLSLVGNPWYDFPQELGQLQQLLHIYSAKDLLLFLKATLIGWFGEERVEVRQITDW